MTLTDTESGDWLMVSQNKIEEVDADGNTCRGNGCLSINVAGQNSWSDVETTEVDDDTTVYSTTFTVVEDGVTFNLIAHVSTSESQVNDTIPCSGCIGDSAGNCQDASMACEDYETGTTCATGFDECVQLVNVTANSLKFAIMLEGATLSDPENKIAYAIEIKDKSGSNGTASTNDDGDSVITFANGEITYPEVGYLVGGSEKTEVDVETGTSTQGSKYILEFVFPAPGDGETLYYDPTMRTAGSISSANAAALACGSLALAAVTMLFV